MLRSDEDLSFLMAHDTGYAPIYVLYIIYILCIKTILYTIICIYIYIYMSIYIYTSIYIYIYIYCILKSLSGRCVFAVGGVADALHGPREALSGGIPGIAFGRLGSFLEPLSSKFDKFSWKLTFKTPTWQMRFCGGRRRRRSSRALFRWLLRQISTRWAETGCSRARRLTQSVHQHDRWTGVWLKSGVLVDMIG